jgi:Flp pilus assembly pilin Flp
MLGNRETPIGLEHFLQEKSGATLMEYALLASLASVVCLIALLALLKNS